MRSAFLFLLLTVVVPLSASQVTEDPRERDMLSIAHELRCAVCQNQSIAESDADLARDMRDVIREQLAAGKSRSEILDYFVGRYGDYVLMKPRYAGPGILIWLGPVVLMLALAVPAFVYLRRRLRVPAAVPPVLTPEDAARVREAQRQARE